VRRVFTEQSAHVNDTSSVRFGFALEPRFRRLRTIAAFPK
jgi:hypothetical protein